MAGMDPEAPTPTLDRARSGGGWRLPLAAIFVAVVALAGLTRLGGSDTPPNALPTLAPSQIDLFAHTPAPSRPPVGLLAGVMPRSPDGLTYADGIPTGISTQPVYRVRDALLVPVGRTMLVGGWYHQPHCFNTGRDRACTAATLSDVPLVQGQGDVRTSFIALDSPLDGVRAHVVLVIVVEDPGCSIHDAGACQPRLRVLQDIWSGVG
ncbi:MAG: hypothetical protein QOJ81_1473 [Chloroflexota bacterium]|jgi:hypothetical protein|nr:hypothetical protein [Chloroflexota bacterium]